MFNKTFNSLNLNVFISWFIISVSLFSLLLNFLILTFLLFIFYNFISDINLSNFISFIISFLIFYLISNFILNNFKFSNKKIVRWLQAPKGRFAIFGIILYIGFYVFYYFNINIKVLSEIKLMNSNILGCLFLGIISYNILYFLDEIFFSIIRRKKKETEISLLKIINYILKIITILIIIYTIFTKIFILFLEPNKDFSGIIFEKDKLVIIGDIIQNFYNDYGNFGMFLAGFKIGLYKQIKKIFFSSAENNKLNEFYINNSIIKTTSDNQKFMYLKTNNIEINKSPILKELSSNNKNPLSSCELELLSPSFPLVGVEYEAKYHFIFDVLNSEIKLVYSLISLLVFLMFLISFILLKYNPEIVDYIRNIINKFPFSFLRKILNLYLDKVLLGAQNFKIIWMYFTFFLLLMFSISLYIGLNKCIEVLI